VADCQVCYEPLVYGERFCYICWAKINKCYEKKYKKRAMANAIREVALEVRNAQYLTRLDNGPPSHKK
jgi:hypothetical protein